MTERQLTAWNQPCKTLMETQSAQYARKFELDGVQWLERFAIILFPSAVPVASWYMCLSGYNRKGMAVPVTDRDGKILWNRTRTQIAAGIADDEFKGVGHRKPNGDPDVTVVPGDVAWHFYLPLSGDESINVKR